MTNLRILLPNKSPVHNAKWSPAGAAFIYEETPPLIRHEHNRPEGKTFPFPPEEGALFEVPVPLITCTLSWEHLRATGIIFTAFCFTVQKC